MGHAVNIYKNTYIINTHTYIHTYLYTMFAVDKASKLTRMKECYFPMHLSIYTKHYVEILGYISTSQS
jgi:hypothetical protein